MIGKTLSHYRIESELGRGGMGVVYRAHDELLKRDVALKLLREDAVGQADHRTRLLSEARAASALNHPGITTIYEVGESDGQLFIVMELVQGETLRRQISSTGPLEPRAVARLGAQISEALHAAHSHGVIHGDIKPENIVVQTERGPKLFDFGIARRLAEETATSTRSAKEIGETPAAFIAGTIAYMAPEVIRGEPADARGDLYSFGVVLFELITGHRPFPGPTISALMAQILHEPTPWLGGAKSIVPAELARMVQKLLEKEPGSRYQTARDLQVDFTNLQRELEFRAALPAAALGKRAVAVLPFKLLTPNPEDEYLGVALADAVINHLGGSGQLLVRPTNTVQRYAKNPVDPLLAAREMNVQVIVDGSIQKFGTRLRVHYQAWNAADGTTILSGKHDSEMADLFGLQDKIAEALAGALGIAPGQAMEAAAVPPTKNATAYELYLRAAERLARMNRWDTRTAIEMLESATKLDPRFAEAWARMAETYILMATVFEPKPAWFRQADRAIRRALALDKNCAEAHSARGRVLWTPSKGFKNRLALRAFAQALRLNPGCYSALLWSCTIKMHVGLHEESSEGLALALASHPDDAFALVFAGQTAQYQGKYEEADEYQARALALDPSNLWANVFHPTAPLYMGQLDRAEKSIRAAEQVVPGDPWLASCEALLLAKRGEMRKAESLLTRALKGGKPLLHTHHMWHNGAAIYSIIGKPKLAIPWLQKAGKLGLPNYPAFRDDPHFKPLQSFAPFLRLLADLKKETESYRREFGNASLLD
jgi:TolB-like protein/tRNA A-37 threonylcarbamoyl transferase component Bud32/Tfp pilus assembly protein PilF